MLYTPHTIKRFSICWWLEVGVRNERLSLFEYRTRRDTSHNDRRSVVHLMKTLSPASYITKPVSSVSYYHVSICVLRSLPCIIDEKHMSSRFIINKLYCLD